MPGTCWAPSSHVGAFLCHDGLVSDFLTLTLAELAELVELPERTIRLYRSKGLVGPPKRVGRVARYGEDHVRQLRLAKVLTARGFPLATIAELIHHRLGQTAMLLLLDVDSPQGRSPGRERTARLSRLAQQDVGSSAPDVIPSLAELGLVSLDPDGAVRADALGLAVISDLLHEGMSPAEAGRFVSDVADVAAKLTGVIDAQLHPNVPDTGFERVLIDAATVVFRETLVKTRKR